MSFVEHLNVSLASVIILVPTLVILGHLIPWFVDPHGLRSFPGPWLAHFSDVWLGRVAHQGHRSEVVHELHQKYGEFEHVILIILLSDFNPPLRHVCPHCPKPPIGRRSRSIADRLRTWKRLT